MDAAGDLLVAEAFTSQILRVDSKTGQLTVAVGIVHESTLPTNLGDGGPANQALLNFPEGLAIRKVATGEELYIYDSCNQRIRMVLSTDGFKMGSISTVLGAAPVAINGAAGGFSGDGASGVSALLDLVRADLQNPNNTGQRARGALAVDAGILYVGDQNNKRIRALDLTARTVRTVAGGGTLDREGGALDVNLDDSAGLAVDADGNLVYSDLGHHVLRKIWRK